MTTRCYTTGYAGKDPSALAEQIHARQARLLDIRLYPTSTQAGWNRNELQSLFGPAYHHLPYLGNKAKFDPQGGAVPVDIVDLDKGLAFVQREMTRRSVVLMCACRRWEHCHRRVVAEALWASKVRTEELPDVEGVKRKPVPAVSEEVQPAPVFPDAGNVEEEDVVEVEAMMMETENAHEAAWDEPLEEEFDVQDDPRLTLLAPPVLAVSHAVVVRGPVPSVEEMAQWHLTEASPGRWRLIDPTNPERVLYLYVLEEQGQRVYRVGATKQVGPLLPPLPFQDEMPWWEPKRKAWEAEECAVIHAAFKAAKRAQKPARQQAA